MVTLERPRKTVTVTNDYLVEREPTMMTFTELPSLPSVDYQALKRHGIIVPGPGVEWTDKIRAQYLAANDPRLWGMVEAYQDGLAHGAK